MSVKVQLIANGRDNNIQLKLIEDKQPADLTDVTRVLIIISPTDGANPTTVDSDVAAAGSFDWSTGGGVLILNFGGLALPADEGVAEVVTIDGTNLNGLTWGTFPVTIR